MALNIKNGEVERLAAQVAALTGETKTEAIRKALAERRERLRLHVTHDGREGRLRRLLETEIWPAVPRGRLGKRLTRREEAAIPGYGPGGV